MMLQAYLSSQSSSENCISDIIHDGFGVMITDHVLPCTSRPNPLSNTTGPFSLFQKLDPFLPLLRGFDEMLLSPANIIRRGINRGGDWI